MTKVVTYFILLWHKRKRSSLLLGTLNEVTHLMMLVTLLPSHWLTDLESSDVTFLKYSAGFKRVNKL